MKKTSVKLWVWSAIILVLGYLAIYDINKHIPLDHHIFYDMFYKERLIEALKKNNVEYLIDNDNKDAIFLHVKDREKVLKIESILNNQYQEYGLSNTDHKNDFLQLLTDNNITYKRKYNFSQSSSL